MKSEAPERIWIDDGDGDYLRRHWYPTEMDGMPPYIRDDLKSEVTVQEAAQRLLDLLSMARTGRPEISKESAQELWDSAHYLRGFHAVNGFLTACTNLPPQEPKS